MKFLRQLSLALLCLQGKKCESSYHKDWMQISPNVEFQHNTKLTMDSSQRNRAIDAAMSRFLYSNNMQSSTNPSYMYQNVDASAEYNEYALAWRLLGYYMDCSYAKNHRSLKDQGGNYGCQRLVLYGVYANLEYEGGGIGEYAFYNRYTGEWLCYDGGSCRTKMDCHEAGTDWKLLGVFKIDNISEGNGWMEQLFKHEGVCVWGDDTYSFASKMRENVPKNCKVTTQTVNNGETYLYYGVKPEVGGQIALGLYTDSMCSKEYFGDQTFDVYQLAGTDQSYWTSFNEALDVYKQCQPCIAYDLSVSGFQCDDEAGYTNCNQCMKFSAKAGCQHADLSDIKLASKQNGLVSFQMNGQRFGGVGNGGNLQQENYAITQNNSRSVQTETSTSQSKSFLFAALFFIVGAALFIKTSKAMNSPPRMNSNGTTPALLDDEDFKSTGRMPVMLKRIYRSFRGAKVAENNVELFIAPNDENAETYAENKASIRKKGSKLFKKLSKAFWAAKSVPEKRLDPEFDPATVHIVGLSKLDPSVEKLVSEQNNLMKQTSTYSDGNSVEMDGDKTEEGSSQISHNFLPSVRMFPSEMDERTEVAPDPSKHIFQSPDDQDCEQISSSDAEFSVPKHSIV